jgi:hypothetical protein
MRSSALATAHGGWCGVTWNGESASVATHSCGRPAGNSGLSAHRYHAGHYPTADAYYDLPPYADINPNFYSWCYFLMAQERNRYRYVPHIFHRYE